jgi:hypothetical protein
MASIPAEVTICVSGNLLITIKPHEVTEVKWRIASVTRYVPRLSVSLSISKHYR